MIYPALSRLAMDKELRKLCTFVKVCASMGLMLGLPEACLQHSQSVWRRR